MSKPKFGSIYHRTKRQPDGTVKTLPTWWIKYRKNGQVFRESSGSETYADAERLLKRRLGEIVTGKFAGLHPERVRMAELFEDVLQDYRDNDRATLHDVELRIRKHLLPAFGSTRAAELSTAAAKRYSAVRRQANCEGTARACNATINRELSVLKRALHLAAMADPPKIARVPYIPMLKEQNVRTGFVEYDAYVRLRDELPECLRPLYVVAYHVGARRGELTRIQWPQVDFAASRITLHPGETKNDEPRTLPIYGEMREWLLMAKEARDLYFPQCPWVFHEKGRRIQTFQKAWASACQRAGVPDLLFHDLRRSAVRNMERAGIPRKVAMAISGHKTESVYRRYDIVAERDLSYAAARLESYLENQAQARPVTEGPGSPSGTRLGTLLGTPWGRERN